MSRTLSRPFLECASGYAFLTSMLCPCAAVEHISVPASCICGYFACNHVDMHSAFVLALVYHSAVRLIEILHHNSIGCVVFRQLSVSTPSSIASATVTSLDTLHDLDLAIAARAC